MYTKLTDTNGRPVNLIGTGAASVTPNDGEDLPGGVTNGLYVGASGDVAVTMSDGTEVTFTALAAGVVHHISIKRVKATGTTATGIVAIY